MPSNRRRNANAVPLASIAVWILVCLFIGTSGLGYVWLKNDLHVNGAKIKKLERELDELGLRNRAKLTHIAFLSSTDSISKHYLGDKSRLGGLIEIPNEHIVFVGRVKAPSIGSEADLRKVAIQEDSRP